MSGKRDCEETPLLGLQGGSGTREGLLRGTAVWAIEGRGGVKGKGAIPTRSRLGDGETERWWLEGWCKETFLLLQLHLRSYLGQAPVSKLAWT